MNGQSVQLASLLQFHIRVVIVIEAEAASMLENETNARYVYRKFGLKYP